MCISYSTSQNLGLPFFNSKDIFITLILLNMKKKAAKLIPDTTIPDTTTQFVEPSYFKELGIVWTNDKVGQTFVTTIRHPLPKNKDS
jgi:hypothetical protein